MPKLSDVLVVLGLAALFAGVTMLFSGPVALTLGGVLMTSAGVWRAIIERRTDGSR
jgi:hypothetical protein